ncbi:MAG: helix-turn-helix domain-containing protein, partial [Acidimicrobiia bacterium]
MNLKEAAHHLGVHYQTAYKWVRAGELVAVRVGGRYEVSPAAIQRFEASRSAVVEDDETIRHRVVSRPAETDPED